MARLGPKYTGNKAHTTFVEFLATEFKKAGCDVARDRYTLPRWEAKRWSLEVTPGEGVGFNAPATSYFPYSGHTSGAGVGGEIVYAGRSPNFTLDGLRGRVALIDFATNTREWAKVYQPWASTRRGRNFPIRLPPARGQRPHAVHEGRCRRGHPWMDRHLGRERRPRYVVFRLRG